ncbi:MAG: hypothetical protein Q4G68_03525 [Planctomycetia bacterium]|nr:hypothetical protein [Planctomycetia bacterium]
MVSSHRKTYKTLFTTLQKRYSTCPATPERSCEVLEMLIYAMFLENSSIVVSNRCLKTLEEYFIDWNEIRVSTAAELGEVFPGIFEPNKVGERIRRTLQWLFENIYKFDLEEYRAQGQAELKTFLESIPFTTHFISDATSSLVFKMLDIPLDEGMKRVLRLLDLIEVDETNHEAAPGLANAFTQSDRLQFFSLLHELGAELMMDPESDSVRVCLETIDPKVRQRSWVPLVESDEVTDPVLIAREVMRNERKQKSFPFVPFVDELDLLNEQLDEDPVIDKLDDDDDEPFDEEPGVYDDSVLADSLIDPLDERIDLQPDKMTSAPMASKKSESVSGKSSKAAGKASEKTEKTPKSGKTEKGTKEHSDSAKSASPAKSVKKASPESKRPVSDAPREKSHAKSADTPPKPSKHPVKKVVEGRRRTPAAAEPPNPEPVPQGVKKTGPKGVAVRSKEIAKKASGSRDSSSEVNAKVSPVKKLQQKKPR